MFYLYEKTVKHKVHTVDKYRNTYLNFYSKHAWKVIKHKTGAQFCSLTTNIHRVGL